MSKFDLTTARLVNLENGMVMNADRNALRSHGIPEGYQLVENISTEEWITALKKALNRK